MTAGADPAGEVDALYREIILEHYRRPHHRGLLEPFDAQAHHVNPTCGDELTVRVRLDGARVTSVSYDGQGCSISQASASVMGDLVEGRSVGDALALHEEFVAMVSSRGTDPGNEDHLQDAVAFAGVARYPARVKCALLAWMAFKDATARAVAAQEGGSR